MGNSISLDFHAHILPAADHGAACVEESLSFLCRAAQAGVQTVVATPHFYPHEHRVSSFLANRQNAYDTLMGKWTEDLPRVLLGAEVLLCEGLDRMEGIELLCANQTNVMLLELPFSISCKDDERFETMERLITQKGLELILAHPNRYPEDAIQRAQALGCRLQLNVSDTVRWRERKRVTAWLRAGAVAYMGSDLHRDGTVYRLFEKAGRIIQAHADELGQAWEPFLRPIGSIQS